MGQEKQTNKVEVPKYLDRAAREVIGRAMQTSRIGYVPYYGPDVAAMTPMQMSAMRGTNQAAGAFGMPTANLSQGMPQAQSFGGIMGYSSGPGFDAAMRELQQRRPGQAQALSAQFINPKGGKK
jgi:hypothetical protein